MPDARSRPFAWPLLLLLLSLGVMLGTAWQAHRLQRQRQQTTLQLLHDYAAFGAWTYRQQLSSQLQEVSWQVVNPVMHRELHQPAKVPDARALVHYRERSLLDCRCDSFPRPASYFSFTLGRDTLAVAGDSLPPAARRTLLATLTGFLRAPADPPRARIAVLGPSPSLPVMTSYGLMPTVRGDTLVYGFTFDRPSLRPAFDSLLARRDLLPRAVSGGRTGSEMLALQVLDRMGDTLYRDARWPAGTQVAEETLDDRVGALRVRMTVLPAAATALVEGGYPSNELPVLLTVVGLASLMAIVAVLQLRREQQLARLRSEFVASVSHELRTPLAQIRLFLDTLRLKRYRTDDEREWLVGHLTRETTRLEHLVENVLHFSRLERGGGPAPPLERVDLAAVTRETAEGFAPLAQSRRARLVLELTPGLEARVDPARFRQVLLNLLDNAVKFGPAGQEVTIRLARVNGSARLQVEDQGPGIPPEERAAVWEPYVRGAGAGAVGGSGIGLAIVEEVVRRMQGRSWVDTAPGGGAAVVVELPLAGDGAPGGSAP